MFLIIISLNGVNYILMNPDQIGRCQIERKVFIAHGNTLLNLIRPLSKNERKVLKNWAQDAEVALARALSELGISESNIQSYLEGHLLSLPGWAGMIRWRSQQSIQEQELS